VVKTVVKYSSKKQVPAKIVFRYVSLSTCGKSILQKTFLPLGGVKWGLGFGGLGVWV